MPTCHPTAPLQLKFVKTQMPLMGRRGGCVCEMRAPSRARRCLFVGLLQAVALACVRPASAHACDRARSRVARKILDAELYSKVCAPGPVSPPWAPGP